MTEALPIVCIASSPLQLSVFRASVSTRGRPVTLVGGRGMRGDVTYQASVLNSASFIADLDRWLAPSGVEIYLPNSLNLLFYCCAADPRVRRISFIDEGGLTKQFVEGGWRKPMAPHHRPILWLTRRALGLGGPARFAALKALSILIRKLAIQPYVSDPARYPYRTIERSEKPGLVLSHTQREREHAWVEHVDLAVNFDFEEDYAGHTCLFLHPRDVQDGWLSAELSRDPGMKGGRLLVRPHPLFNQWPGLLDGFLRAMGEAGVDCRVAELSGEHDVTFELYARGVRTFVCGASSIRDTVSAYPNYFVGLRLEPLPHRR